MEIYTSDSSVTFEPEASFEDCEFRAFDFSVHNLKSVSFLNCKFTNCNMANIQLMNASMRDITFESCNLIGVNWCNLRRYEDLKFKECKLNFSSFQGLKLKRTEIINSLAVDVDFSGCDLSLSNFSGSGFAGANFEAANLTDTDFRSSRDYLFDLRKAKIKGAKFTYPHVMALLTALGAEIEF